MSARIGSWVFALSLTSFLLLGPAFGQRGGRGGGGGSSTARFDFYGRVALEEGSVPADKIMIESICNGVVYQETYVDKQGKFRFTLANSSATVDATTRSMSDSPVLPECVIRATGAGYRSDVVNLGERNRSTERSVAQNPDLGTLVLRKPSGAEAASISATSQKAPKDAKKAFDKGVSAARDKKWDEAAKNYQKAVELYPAYAEAWFRLGEAQAAQNQLEPARKSFDAAIKADGNYVLPVIQMSNLEAQAANWKAVAELTDRVIKLAPGIPRVYLLSSIAYLSLRDVNSAEKSAREGLLADKRHDQAPRLFQILATVLANKGDFVGAAAQLEQYLQFAPFANDAAVSRKQMEEWKARGAGAPPAKQ